MARDRTGKFEQWILTSAYKKTIERQLPDKWDIHEYDIMARFVQGIENTELADKLSNAIRGKGAFRRFTDLIYEYEIQDQWYAYHGDAIRGIAIDWCREQNIEYIDEMNR